MPGKEESPYAGRWVARVRGRIVAQGGTPEQARRAAQSRFKEIPEILFMPVEMTLPPIVEKVREVLPPDQKVYLVGGAVRDILLQRKTHDYDFTLERGAIKLARQAADRLGADFYPLDVERDTGRVLMIGAEGDRTILDFASFRGPDLEADLLGRDFTLNAIALDMSDNSLHDPLGGGMDLRNKILRPCSATALMDDPVRVLRGIRLAASFGFHLSEDGREQEKAAAALLGRISPERLRDELFRILEGPKPAACLRILDQIGALAQVLPEIPPLKGEAQRPPHVHDVWDHTLAVVKYLESTLAALDRKYDPEAAGDWHNGLLVLRLGRYREELAQHLAAELIPGRSLRSLLFLAAVYHDAAKPAAKTMGEDGLLRFYGHDEMGAEVAARRARALMLSNDEVDRLENIVRGHMRIHFFTNRLLSEGQPPSRRAVYRFFRQNREAGVDICLLTLADLRATYEQTLPQKTWTACLDVVRMLLEAWYEKREEAVSPPALLDGNELMKELDLKPGPQVGRLIEAIREAQAAGEVSSREEALSLARKRLEQKK